MNITRNSNECLLIRSNPVKTKPKTIQSRKPKMSVSIKVTSGLLVADMSVTSFCQTSKTKLTNIVNDHYTRSSYPLCVSVELYVSAHPVCSVSSDKPAKPISWSLSYLRLAETTHTEQNINPKEHSVTLSSKLYFNESSNCGTREPSHLNSTMKMYHYFQEASTQFYTFSN